MSDLPKFSVNKNRQGEVNYVQIFGKVPYCSIHVSDVSGCSVSVGCEDSTGTDSTTFVISGPIEKFVYKDERKREYTSKEKLKEQIVRLGKLYIRLHRAQTLSFHMEAHTPLWDDQKPAQEERVKALKAETKRLHDECEELEHAIMNKIDSMKE